MRRLRAYREIEGINQAELGELLGLSPQMISAIESGRRPFNGSLLPTGYADSRINVPDMSEPLHRHKASTGVAAKNRARELLRLGGEVFAELGETTPRMPRLTLERIGPPSTFEELDDLAVEVRYMLGIEESGPIQNLTLAVEKAGVCLIPIVGLQGIDGLSAWVGDVPVVGLSPSVPGDRFRHTLAHEIGHLLFHRTKGNNSEREANRFAGSLLFPRDEFDEAVADQPYLRHFVSLKSTWGVSVASLVYRAHEFSYLDDARYRALQIQMSKWRKTEPGEFTPLHGQLLPKMVELNGGVRSAAARLGVPEAHLNDVTNWNGLRLVS